MQLPICRPWDKDRQASIDIDAVTELVRDGKIWDTIKSYIANADIVTNLNTAVHSPTSYSINESVNNGHGHKKRKVR